MLLTRAQARAVLPPRAAAVRRLQATGFGAWKTTPWLGGTLPVLLPDDATPSERALLAAACDEWSRAVPVRCAAYASGPAYRIVRAPLGSGCWSTVGMGEDGGQMSVDPRCWTKPLLIHELGHAFGLGHEHNRPDRDQYITVLWSNLMPGSERGYFKMNYDVQELPYDFLSIMHYPAWFGAQRGLPAFLVKPRYARYKKLIGNAKKPSAQDALSLTKAYQLSDPAGAGSPGGGPEGAP